MYRKGLIIRHLLLLSLASVLLTACSWAQSSDQAQQADVQSNSGAVPAMGQTPTPPDSSQFPPLSGLDEPSLEPNIAARSFFAYGAQGAELVDSNASNSLGKSHEALTGVTHLLGTVGLQRLWERYQLGLSYVGGGALYAGGSRENSQIHELKFDARTTWRTGALTLRDSASYLPDGTFGGAGIGGAGLGLQSAGFGGASGNRFTFFGSNQFGALGALPRVTNLAVIDLQQSVSPRTSFTLSGGYNLMHFTKSTGGLLIDSRETSAQAGYDYAINRRNKIALIYGYQHFQFPYQGGLSFVTHIVQAMYGHQISGRMDLLLGAGPQFTLLNSPTQGQTTKVSASARASLRYRFPRTTLSLNYDRYNSAAAGFFAGAETDMARFTVSRALARRWTLTGDVAYVRYRRLQTAAVGVHAGNVQSGFAGARLYRIFSRSLSGFLLYSFDDLRLSRDFCGTGGNCDRISNRHIFGAGLTWHPPAIRLD